MAESRVALPQHMSSLDIEVQGIFHIELLRLVLLPENSHHRNQACLWRSSPFNLTLLHQVIHELQYSLQVTMLAIPDKYSSMKTDSHVVSCTSSHKETSPAVVQLAQMCKTRIQEIYLHSYRCLFGIHKPLRIWIITLCCS